MPDFWMDVDTALSEVPVNLMPLIDDTTFKDIEDAVAYNAAGMALRWHFVTTGGAYTVTSVTPTTGGGDYDWTDQGDSGIYTIEIPASGGASINNDTEGFGWFTGKATGILPWRGPTIGFRAAALNNALIDGGDLLDVNVTHVADTAQTGRDIGASVLLSPGTGTGQILLSNGKVDAYAINGETQTAVDIGGALVQLVPQFGNAVGATGNTTTTIHLSGIATYDNDEIVDHLLIIFDGSTGESHSRWITAFNGTTDVATVATLPFTPQATVDLWTLTNIRRNTKPESLGTQAKVDVNAEADTALSDWGKTGFSLASTGMDSVTLPANIITNTSIANDAITASKVAADVHQELIELAFTYDATANYAGATTGSLVLEIADNAGGTALTAAAIADAVWDEDATGHQTQGTFGQAIGDPGADSSTIWGLANTNLDAAVSSRSSHSAADVWAAVTRTLTAGTNIQLPANGLANVTAWTVDITGNITGNLSGSAGSVTGAVGSVTGNVGGNVVGSVASVTGAVGSVTGNVGGNVTGSVGSLATQAKADVNAEVLDVLNVDTLIDGKTFKEAMLYVAAICAGRVSGAGTGTEVFKGLDEATTRVTVTVDSSGNRTDIVYG